MTYNELVAFTINYIRTAYAKLPAGLYDEFVDRITREISDLAEIDAAKITTDHEQEET